MRPFVAVLVLQATALLGVSCSEPRESWYDKTSQANDQRSEKIKSLQAQGFDTIAASREADLQSAIKATERGEGVPPLEGSELKSALDQPR